MDLRSCTAKEIRSLLDECHADIRMIAKLHPDLIPQLENQFRIDKEIYGILPIYLRVQTNEGLINTTIRYNEFIRFLPIWKQRPDIIDSTMAGDLIRPSRLPLLHESKSATELLGQVPNPKKN